MNSADTPAGLPSNGKRILIAEDDAMIRMLLEDMVEDLGYTVAADAARLDEALRAAKTMEIDLAILDVNLGGQSIAAVADVLAERGIPFIFATGYGVHGLPEVHNTRPVLKKPFEMARLEQALAAIVSELDK